MGISKKELEELASLAVAFSEIKDTPEMQALLGVVPEVGKIVAPWLKAARMFKVENDLAAIAQYEGAGLSREHAVALCVASRNDAHEIAKGINVKRG